VYVRSDRAPTGRTVPLKRLRALLVVLYTAYPLGWALQFGVEDGGPTSLVADGVGLALVFVAVLAFSAIARSSVQRIMHEPEEVLDERERAERNRAHQSAYVALSAILLLGLIHQMLAQDLSANGWVTVWTPTTYHDWSVVFWGMTFLAFTLPTAFHAFRARPGLEEEPA
jgi:hypothetical protein